MSQERLRLKLMAAGWDEEMVVALDREELIARYVELLANPQPVPAVAMDPELEKEKLAFEKQRWEAEHQLSLELEKEKLQLEKWRLVTEAAEREKERELERKKIDADIADRERERQLKQQKIDLEKIKAETEHQRVLAEQEKEKRKESGENGQVEQRARVAGDEQTQKDAATAKLLGDVMRNSVIKMGADPIDAVAFFNNVVQLFTVYSVPVDLKARLINPYLNERAQKIVGKLTADVAKDYEQVKTTIL